MGVLLLIRMVRPAGGVKEKLDKDRPGEELGASRMLKNPFSPRLLKKVQTTHPADGYPAARDARAPTEGGSEAYLVRTSQRRASAPTPQMGLFQQPARIA